MHHVSFSHLQRDQGGRDADLRRRTDIPWPNSRPRGRVEDPGDPVRLGQQCPVNGAETHPNAESLQDAGDGGGRCQQQERVQVTDEHSGQQNDRQLASRGPDHRRVSMVEQ